MNISSITSLITYFTSYQLSPEERKSLINETALLTLARATSSDFNIRPVEVTTVQRALKENTGIEVSEAEIRIAAKSELFEKEPLERHLKDISRFLDLDAKMLILEALTEVIKADERISPKEVEFVNMIGAAFQLRISDVLKIKADE